MKGNYLGGLRIDFDAQLVQLSMGCNFVSAQTFAQPSDISIRDWDFIELTRYYKEIMRNRPTIG